MSLSLGHIAALWRYPVKSMRGEALQSLAVDVRGAVGDRYFALKDSEGRLGSGKTSKRFRQIDGLLGFTAATENGAVVVHFPDGRTMRADDPSLGAILTAACGMAIKIGSEDQDRVMHRDSAPLHLLSEASIAWLQKRLPAVAIDARRFRPNIVIATEAAGLVEQAWLGREIAVGDELVVKVARPTVRCVMATLPQAELGAAPAVLRTLPSRMPRRSASMPRCCGPAPCGLATNCASSNARQCARPRAGRARRLSTVHRHNRRAARLRARRPACRRRKARGRARPPVFAPAHSHR